MFNFVPAFANGLNSQRRCICSSLCLSLYPFLCFAPDSAHFLMGLCFPTVKYTTVQHRKSCLAKTALIAEQETVWNRNNSTSRTEPSEIHSKSFPQASSLVVLSSLIPACPSICGFHSLWRMLGIDSALMHCCRCGFTLPYFLLHFLPHSQLVSHCQQHLSAPRRSPGWAAYRRYIGQPSIVKLPSCQPSGRFQRGPDLQ